MLKKTDRDSFKEKVEQAGHVALFHYVDAQPSIRRQRVLRRNLDKGETYSFDVTPGMFEAMESYFERPTESELSDRQLVRAPQE